MPADNVEGISITDATKLLKVNDMTMRGLIEHGFLVPGERIRKFGFAPVAYLKPQDVEDFKMAYGGMTSIANELGIAVAYVSRVIAAANIEPLYPVTQTLGKGRETRMFDRRKVVQALCAAGLVSSREQ